MKGQIEANDDNNSIYRIERAICAYDFKRDLEEKNSKISKNTYSSSNSFDESFSDNFSTIVNKLNDESERKKTDKNFFNKSFQMYLII